jgi:predicted DCC family thiol-disulfide oxidoreductase YuxK
MTTATQNDKTTTHHKARVLFDGQCALCRKSVQLLRSFDWLKRLDYVDVRDPSQADLQNPLVIGAPLLDQMHVLTPDNSKIYGGFAAFRWMAWRLPLFFLMAPFLYLPGVPWLGDRIYKWIARNRFRLVPCHDGVCTIPDRQGKSA